VVTALCSLFIFYIYVLAATYLFLFFCSLQSSTGEESQISGENSRRAATASAASG